MRLHHVSMHCERRLDCGTLTVIQSSAASFVNLLSSERRRQPRPATGIMVDMGNIWEHRGDNLDPTRAVADDGHLLPLGGVS